MQKGKTNRALCVQDSWRYLGWESSTGSDLQGLGESNRKNPQEGFEE